MNVSAAVGEKALRLYEDGCVRLAQGYAIVKGDTAWHKVVAEPDGLRCDCAAWRSDRDCSHSAAAAIAWAEQAKEA